MVLEGGMPAPAWEAGHVSLQDKFNVTSFSSYFCSLEVVEARMCTGLRYRLRSILSRTVLGVVFLLCEGTFETCTKQLKVQMVEER